MASVVTIQNSLNAGELAPSLKGKTDLEKYHSGCSTARNFFSNYRGGVSSRAGLAYVGTCKQQYPTPPRDIPFQFSLNQGYVLEFGELYLRIKSNGAYVTEASKVVTSVSAAGLFTAAAHGYSVGDWVYDTDNTGFSSLTWIVHTVPTANTFTVTDLFGNVISSATASGAGTVARIYTVVAPYHATDLRYLKYTQSADVMTLTCVNTETAVEYPPYSLTRNSNVSWVFAVDTFAATIQPPTNLTAVAQSSTTPTTWYSYVVTAVSSLTGEESTASASVSVQNNDIAINVGSNDLSWTGVANADSYNVYAATPAYGFTVPVSSLYGFIGTSLGPSFTDTNIVPDFTVVPPQHQNPFEIGTILDINPTAGGTNYSQSTIGYTLTTATGSGFSGTPVAAAGKFAGFIILNHGKDYLPGDTVTITDSGGGVATGNFSFAAKPADGNNIKFNEQVLTFKNTPVNSADIHIEATLALTLQATANFLNAQSQNLSLVSAYYTTDATHIYVTYKTPGAVGNAYTLDALTSGGTRSAATLTGGGTAGSGATATLVIGPQTGRYPSVCSYFQQRRVYASSLNDPDTYWMSKPGLFSNMDSAVPTVASDAIIGTPWAQQVNGIQFLVSMPGGLVVLTGKGAWQVNGGGSAAITPSTQTAIPQAYNGCNALVPPIQNNYDILYIQSKGSIARDLAYNFFTNIYTGTDLTVLSNHLFQNYQITQWAWAEEPYKLIWLVRDDGTMLCLTYLKEQDIYAWTRHDTSGLFVGVCSVTEPPVDAVYVIVQRYVQGAWRYYSERMDNRVWSNVNDAYCVDSGLSWPMQSPATSLVVSAASGTGVSFTSGVAAFSSGSVGNVIRCGGGKATVVTYVSTTEVLCDITEDITDVVPDGTGNMPVPFETTGSWTVSVPTSTVSGLNHLEGLTVTALADGSVVPNQVVTNGSVTLPNPASQVVVGLPYTCQAQTMYLDYPTKDGTAQDRRKNISAVGIRVEATRGIQLGADQPDQSDQQNNAPVTWTGMQEVKERNPTVYPGIGIPLYSGDYYKAITSGWDLRGQVAIQQVYPLPANILSVIAYVQSGDDKA